MNITEREILHLAELSKLRLSDGDAARYQKELSGVLSLIAEVQEAKISAAENSARTVPLDALRKDVSRVGFTNEKVLMNAPAQADGGFLVPQVVE